MQTAVRSKNMTTATLETKEPKLRYNKAVVDLPEVIKVSDLDNFHGRQLRNLAVAYKIGEPKWRNTADKKALIEALTESFPNGEIKVIKATDVEEAPTTPVTAPTAKAPKAKAPAEAAPLRPGLLQPKEDASFVFNEELRNYLSTLRRMSSNGVMMNSLLTGPQGCGKTSVAYEFAAKMKLPLLKMNCPMVREPRDWFGAKRAENGSVFWDKALFAEVVADGNVVILLDEITRATPMVLNTLLPLLDWTRETYVEESKEILRVGPGTYFFATANIGAQFTGTMRLDSALADRFGAIVECTFLPKSDEIDLLVTRTGISRDVATKLVTVAEMVRRENQTSGKLTETISTRTLLDIANLYTGLKETAFKFTVLPMFSPDGGVQSERAQVIGFLQGQFPGFK